MPLIVIMFLLRSAFFFSLTCRFLLKFKEHALLGGAMVRAVAPTNVARFRSLRRQHMWIE